MLVGIDTYEDFVECLELLNTNLCPFTREQLEARMYEMGFSPYDFV